MVSTFEPVFVEKLFRTSSSNTSFLLKIPMPKYRTLFSSVTKYTIFLSKKKS